MLYPTDKFCWFNNNFWISQLFPEYLPKDYKLDGIEQTVHIFYSKDDTFAPPQGIEVLAERLSHSELIQVPEFGHFDFVLSEEAFDKVYMPMTQRVSNPGIA